MAKTTKGRVIIPRDVSGTLSLAAKVYAKHQLDTTSTGSPLALLEDYDWRTTGPTILLAQTKHDEAEAMKAKMEQAYHDRDALLTPIVGITNASKMLLKGKFSKNPRRLGDWGYEVDDTPPAKKTAKTKKA